MSQGTPLDGIYAAIPTPFDEGGTIDQKALDHLIDYLLSRDIRGLALLTEAAEDPVLSPEERRSLITAIAGRVKGKKPFLVNISAPATRDAVELAKHAQSKGAAGALLGPYGVPGIGYRELYRHLDRVTKSTELPVLLVLRRENSFDLLAPEELATLSKHPSVRGAYLPEAGPNVIESWVKRFKGRDASIFSGCSLAFSKAAHAGATGVICGLAAIASDQGAKLFEAIKHDYADIIANLEKTYAPAVDMLGPPRAPEELDGVQRFATKLAKRPLEGYQIVPTVSFALIKEALRLQGHPVKNRVRAPYERVSAEASERLKLTLRIAEIIS